MKKEKLISEFLQSTDTLPQEPLAALFVDPWTRSLIRVSGKRRMFATFTTGDLIELTGEYLIDEDGFDYFQAVSCNEIYSKKVRDVLGE
jgi:hypothetical protein